MYYAASHFSCKSWFNKRPILVSASPIVFFLDIWATNAVPTLFPITSWLLTNAFLLLQFTTFVKAHLICTTAALLYPPDTQVLTTEVRL